MATTRVRVKKEVVIAAIKKKRQDYINEVEKTNTELRKQHDKEYEDRLKEAKQVHEALGKDIKLVEAGKAPKYITNMSYCRINLKPYPFNPMRVDTSGFDRDIALLNASVDEELLLGVSSPFNIYFN